MEEECQDSTMSRFIGKKAKKPGVEAWVTTPLGYVIAVKFSLALTKIFIRSIRVRGVV
jgi:hypothetical protein